PEKRTSAAGRATDGSSMAWSCSRPAWTSNTVAKLNGGCALSAMESLRSVISSRVRFRISTMRRLLREAASRSARSCRLFSTRVASLCRVESYFCCRSVCTSAETDSCGVSIGALSDKRTLPPKVYGYVVNSLRGMEISVLGSCGILVVLLRIFSGPRSMHRFLRAFSLGFGLTDCLLTTLYCGFPLTMLFRLPLFRGFGRPNIQVFLFEGLDTTAQF